MVIEVLYIAGCCNYPPALERVRQALRLADFDQPIAEVPVSDEETARALQFPGSPTVRINGVDVESSTGAFIGLGCRLYADGGGLPSEQAIMRAVQVARDQEGSCGTSTAS
jgi:hypothetical protein